jgi:O-antigen/teichoic acid export membrane protein
MNDATTTSGERQDPHSDSGKSKGLSLRRNFAWLSAGQALYALSQWGVLAILAKLLTSQEVGEFALGLAIATWLASRTT